VLYDPENEIFSRYWGEGDIEIQQGYLPQFGNPIGTKMRREPTERPALGTQWLSDRGDTTIRQITKKWGVLATGVEPFVEGLFRFLTVQRLLVPVRLKGSKGKPIPNVSGLYSTSRL
jgi:hypothetical protein